MGVGCPEYILLGLPPRRRGKAASFIGGTWERRITPAWAGKSSSRHPCTGQARDHPRVGGEKFCRVRLCPMCQGSPPRGRGKVHLNQCHWLHPRITPAWAGKRRCTAACNGLCWDHPRVGGEKAPAAGHCSTDTGSPPRGRGKAVRLRYDTAAERITPAWAGKRPPAPRWVTLSRDHPRVGGEK